jgi:tRNA threonylcarbamoyladenosine biosynthesis protein TsaB
MNLLAIETSTEACSVALLTDDGVIERYELAPRRHAELVLPMAESLLAQAQLPKRQLDAIAVGRGPGAFTGVRLGIAVAQGLALALDRPVVPVSTLAALALGAAHLLVGAPEGASLSRTIAPEGGIAVVSSGAPTTGSILALIDARMGEVYAGCFAFDADGLVVAIDTEQLSKPEDLVVPAASDWIAIGSGWAVYSEQLKTRLGGALRCELPAALPRAADVARLAAREFRLGRAVDAATAQPVYLRNKVALTSAERSK